MPHADHDLVRRFVEEGDEAAFRSIVERHAAGVLRTAYAVTGDHQAAEDATQETFQAVSRGLKQGRFEQGRSLRAWILGIAVKRASNLARGRRRARRREEEYAMNHRPPEPGPREQAQKAELQDQLAAAMRDLPPKSRTVLQLHYREGLTHAEVAAALGLARGTVKSRLARALDALRRRFESRGAALSLAELPALLAALPAPEPSAALLETCAAKATATGTAAASGLWGLKAAAAVLVAGTAAFVGAHYAASDDARATRAERTPATRHESVAERVVPAGGETAAPTSDEERGDRSITAPVDSSPQDSAQPVPSRERSDEPSTTGEAKPGRDVLRREDLPEGTQIIRGDGGGAPPGQGVKPGRFQPVAPGRGPRSSKYAPLPALRGESVLSGRVVDVAGTPVEGAEIYRMPLDVDREASTVVSFEFLTKVGTTDAQGRFEATKQAHGTFFLVANYQRRLNRPRGMETRDAIVVQVQEQGRAEKLLLQLPFNVGEFVPLRGVVTDAEGRPVRGAQVFVDYQEHRTDAEGAFDAGRVPVGTHTVVVRRTGYRTLEGTVVADRGQENVAQLVLELEEKGELRLAGLVLDAEGNPVPDATVYLNGPGRTVRRVQTDAKGAYAFETLPERLGDGGCSLNVWVDGYFPKYVKEVRIPADPFEIRIERAYALALRFVSDATGEPLTQTRGEARRQVVTGGQVEFRMFRSWSTYREDGVYDDFRVPAGMLQIEVEAPGHAVTTIEIEVLPGDEPREVEIRLPPAPDKPEGE